MNWQKNLRKVFSGLQGEIRFDEPLRDYTTFKIGGCARIFIEPKDGDDLRLALNLLKKQHLPFFLLGKGSNVLVSDGDLPAAVIRLNAPFFKRIAFKNRMVTAGSGCSLSQLIRQASLRSLGGIEFLWGIPGTVGGAVMMNAGLGQEGLSFADFVEKVKVMDYNGKVKVFPKKKIKFQYRNSNLLKYIILEGQLRLQKRDRRKIKEKIKEYIRQRRRHQDLSFPNAGSVFKNPQNLSAGRLIDLSGLKGKKIGGAAISLKHANFILNQNRASASDVLKLMSLARKKVKQKFNLTLEPELKIWQ